MKGLFALSFAFALFLSSSSALTQQCSTSTVLSGDTCPGVGVPVYLGSAGFLSAAATGTRNFDLTVNGFDFYIGESCVPYPGSGADVYSDKSGSFDSSLSLSLATGNLGGSYVIALYQKAGVTTCNYKVTAGSIEYNTGSVGCNAFEVYNVDNLDRVSNGNCPSLSDGTRIALAVTLPIIGGAVITGIIVFVVVRRRRDLVHKRLSNRLSSKYEGTPDANYVQV